MKWLLLILPFLTFGQDVTISCGNNDVIDGKVIIQLIDGQGYQLFMKNGSVMYINKNIINVRKVIFLKPDRLTKIIPPVIIFKNCVKPESPISTEIKVIFPSGCSNNLQVVQQFRRNGN